jgi:succinate dehydrogenase / fumarate reductase, cytochrome b subunit
LPQCGISCDHSQKICDHNAEKQWPIAQTAIFDGIVAGDTPDFDAIERTARPGWAADKTQGDAMAEIKRVERPLSPHLQIYRMTQITSVSSILIRISGHALMAGVILGVWWLLAAAVSDSYFAVANAVATSWFGDLVFAGSLWAVWYHYLGGLRHLYYDAGRGLDIKTAERLGWACVIGSVVLTVLSIILFQL